MALCHERTASKADLEKTLDKCINFVCKTKFHPHLLHKVTVFFNPKQRSMKVLPSASKDEVLVHIRQQLAQLSEETATTATQEEQPPAKRRRIVDEIRR
ncbi:hypothetical protein LSAT2_030878 [Lamellibrachia satsuma]|nr:hypothetical protein LSAT2_030878 [Lamellibrachia satsuma]